MMKNKNVLLILSVFMFSAAVIIGADAQTSNWVNSGSDIYYNPNPDVITIGSVNYSDENGGPSSTCGTYVEDQCNGKTSCTYTGSDAACGVKPSPGQKNFIFVTYTCGNSAFRRGTDVGLPATYTKHADANTPATLSCPGIGNVGIGTEYPEAKLDVKGEVKFGNSSSACNLSAEGQQRYNSGSHVMEYCDGKTWTAYLTGASIADIKTRLATVEAKVKNIEEACNNINFNLRTVAVGFKCITTSGSYFERVSMEHFGESWKGPDGVIWSDIFPDASLQDAMKKCKDLSVLLPSLDDYTRETKNGLEEVIPNSQTDVWTSTPVSGDPNSEMIYHFDNPDWAGMQWQVIPSFDILRNLQPPPNTWPFRCISH